MSEREKSFTNTASDPAHAAPVRKRRRTDWVGIFTLVFGLLLAAVCLYSALTDPRQASEMREGPPPGSSPRR